MKTLLPLVFLSVTVISCSTVQSKVYSIRNQDVDKSKALVVTKHSSELIDEKVRRECVTGIEKAGLKVLQDCEENCYYVKAVGETGATREVVDTNYNYNTGNYDTESYSQTSRKLKIRIYKSRNLEHLVWQADVDSSGQSDSIIPVVAEMCEAAFRNYPEEVTGKKETVKYDKKN